MGNDLTKWLVDVPDKRHHHNWTIVREPDDLMACRFWMVAFPRGCMTKIKFLKEYAEQAGIVDVQTDMDVPTDSLYFWYNCQRVQNDW